MGKRLPSIDIAKGLAICLMVLGHSSLPVWLSNWIWSFHMPFFFFVSGLLTSWDKSFKTFCIGKTKTLFIPFIIYSVINLLIYPLYGNESWSKFFMQICLNGWGGYALWFIPVLYISLIFCKIIIDRFWINIVSIVFFLVLGAILNYFSIEVPWTLSTVPIACVYILIARMCRFQVKQFLHSKNLKLFIVVIVLGLGTTLFISHYYRLDLAFNCILPIIPLLITAVAGSMMVLCFSEIITMKPKFAQVWIVIGRNTMTILAFSQCLIMIFNHYFILNPLLKYGMLSLALFILTKLETIIRQICLVNSSK